MFRPLHQAAINILSVTCLHIYPVQIRKLSRQIASDTDFSFQIYQCFQYANYTLRAAVFSRFFCCPILAIQLLTDLISVMTHNEFSHQGHLSK